MASGDALLGDAWAAAAGPAGSAKVAARHAAYVAASIVPLDLAVFRAASVAIVAALGAMVRELVGLRDWAGWTRE